VLISGKPEISGPRPGMTTAIVSATPRPAAPLSDIQALLAALNARIRS